MGSSQKRLALLGAWIAALLLAAALAGASGAASAGKASRVPTVKSSAKSSKTSTATATGTRGLSRVRGHRLGKPASPAVVLYDQYNNAAAGSLITDQNFEPSFDVYDSMLADDFVVPSG